MAYDLMERALADPKLRAGPRLVLVVLAQHADRMKNQCYPGVRRIMRMTGMGERTVLRNIELLRESGYVETAKGRSKARTTLYTLLPEKWPIPTSATCQKEQATPAESGVSDLTHCKHNQEGDTEERSGKTKSKAKTCDKSQKEKGNSSSKPMGQSNNRIEVEEEKKKKNETDMENKKFDMDSVAKLAPVPPPPKGKSKLMKLWMEHASKQDVTTCLTAREGRMLHVAAQKIGYGNMELVIPLTITNWKVFTDFCYHQGVAYTRPETPQVAFFVKFVDKAYELVKRRQRRIELEQKQQELTAHIRKLQAKRDELVKAAFAMDESLPMTKKCEVLRLTPKLVAKWEAAFGPVTGDFLQPEFPLPSYIDSFREDPTIELPVSTSDTVVKFQKRWSKIRCDRIWAELRMNRAYEKVAQRIEEMEDRIKEVQSSLNTA